MIFLIETYGVERNIRSVVLDETVYIYVNKLKFYFLFVTQ
jgi:hypothetical protein